MAGQQKHHKALKRRKRSGKRAKEARRQSRVKEQNKQDNLTLPELAAQLGMPGLFEGQEGLHGWSTVD